MKAFQTLLLFLALCLKNIFLGSLQTVRLKPEDAPVFKELVATYQKLLTLIFSIKNSHVTREQLDVLIDKTDQQSLGYTSYGVFRRRKTDGVLLLNEVLYKKMMFSVFGNEADTISGSIYSFKEWMRDNEVLPIEESAKLQKESDAFGALEEID